MIHKQPHVAEAQQLEAFELVSRIACPSCRSDKVKVYSVHRPKRYLICRGCKTHFTATVLACLDDIQPGRYLRPSGL